MSARFRSQNNGESAETGAELVLAMPSQMPQDAPNAPNSTPSSTTLIKLQALQKAFAIYFAQALVMTILWFAFFYYGNQLTMALEENKKLFNYKDSNYKLGPIFGGMYVIAGNLLRSCRNDLRGTAASYISIVGFALFLSLFCALLPLIAPIFLVIGFVWIAVGIVCLLLTIAFCCPAFRLTAWFIGGFTLLGMLLSALPLLLNSDYLVASLTALTTCASLLFLLVNTLRIVNSSKFDAATDTAGYLALRVNLDTITLMYQMYELLKGTTKAKPFNFTITV